MTEPVTRRGWRPALTLPRPAFGETAQADPPGHEERIVREAARVAAELAALGLARETRELQQTPLAVRLREYRRRKREAAQRTKGASV